MADIRKEEECVRVSVRELVGFVLRHGSIDSRFAGFDRANEGSRIHRRLQKAAGKNYRAEVPFKARRQVDGLLYLLEGRADGVLEEADGFVIDEIKTTAAPAEMLHNEDFEPLHWAQAQCYGAFLCAQEELPGVVIQLTYYQIDTGEIIRHRRAFTAPALEAFLLDILHRYAPWARMALSWRSVRNASLRALTFPFPSYRHGQYELAGAVYRTIAGKGRLFCAAPTGIGKTISTLFPSLKALGEEKGERIFYLTAKTITRQAAEDALARLRAHMDAAGCPLRLKTITLTAKDKICPLEERVCTPQSCPRADGYYDRVNEALYNFLQQCDEFTRTGIEAFAAQWRLCPFELALDLTNWCDCIICDYNYLFDPVVSLKRFFTDGGDFIFLVDEAHNLVDRAREMYSARLCKTDVYAVKKALGKGHRRLSSALDKVNAAFIELRHRCEEEGEARLVVREGLPELAKLLARLSAACEDWLEEHREGALHADVLTLYFAVRFFLRIAELYDTNYTTLVFARGSEVCVQLLCLDAAPFLDASMALGRASILFSATLSPSDYFIRTLGGGEARAVRLQSPFPPQRLFLAAADTISTRYADRERTREAVCRMIGAAVGAHAGNYIVFLPSYKYMQDVSDEFSMMYPDTPLAVQESGMDENAREAFLTQFSAGRGGTLVGFCVLGGIFAEGIDLVGDRLIGSIIVGVGLPQVGVEQNALRDYYAETMGMGFEYAYQYPGMNKVLQAAGRVIRTPEDKGIVLLIDSRYGHSGYRSLFPPHWAHCRRFAEPEALTAALGEFWAR